MRGAGEKWRLMLVLLAATIALNFGPERASAFNFLEPPAVWPGDPAVISYFNKASDKKAAVAEAVGIWNRSGIEIHFEPAASEQAAQIVIESSDDAPCGNGISTPTVSSTNGGPFVPTSAVVQLGSGNQEPAIDSKRECRHIDLLTAAHELGHVLGLDHEDDVCALMNSYSVTTPRGPGKPAAVFPGYCKDKGAAKWWCRVLARDDLRGAVRLYGGEPKLRKQEFCEV